MNQKHIPPIKVFAIAGLDNVTSAMCYYQQRFRAGRSLFGFSS